MFSVLSRRTFGVTLASAALIVMTAACGGTETGATGGTAATSATSGTSDAGGAAAVGGAAACQEATKIITDWSSQVTASAGDPDSYNKSIDDLTGKLNDLAGKAEGDVGSALTELSTTFGGLKIDASDPAALAAKLGELATASQSATTKLGNACAAG
ncbi:hypothetical protein Misp01_75040 [Microtetraspora sp. NBRC 13810]|uniref:hypothetical protein n=1 Tax=Microtetraspora sp. NBRC 13810 TaxID=3030990 RepID=UPI0024A1E569|nr:hypothetical protein [Microtetraspora sp. NBRC 13810]GLW12376.1 hypothetical protein Misp01_75040 [Microtetraspora sp. NBRC 13810]